LHLTGQAGTTASAVLTTRGGITYIDLTTTGLDPARTYGVWLQGNDGARSSAGTFQPASAGTVRVALSSAAPLGDSLMFGVTEMPDAENPAAIDILATRL
jgi:Anti-sigma-K factor rskA, C-terminal